MSEPRTEIDAIRVRTWIGAALLLAFAALALDGVRRDALRNADASPRADGVSPPVFSEVAPDVASRRPEGDRPRRERRLAEAAHRAPQTRAIPHAAERRHDAATNRVEPDSRLLADLRIFEEEAAQRTEATGLAADAAGESAAPDARRAALADAFLIDWIVQDAYRGTEFPLGFPAEERTYEAARSRVGGLDAAARKGLLEAALASPPAERIEAPRFEARFWEGVLP